MRKQFSKNIKYKKNVYGYTCGEIFFTLGYFLNSPEVHEK